VCAFYSLPSSELALRVPRFNFSSARRLPDAVQELITDSYSLLLGSDRLLGECLFGSRFLSFPSSGLQPVPIEFSLPIFVLAPLFRAGFSRRRLVPRELIFGLSVESLTLPSLISLDPLCLCRPRLHPVPDRFFCPMPRMQFYIHVSPLVDFLLTLLAVVSRARSVCFQWSTRVVLLVLQKGQFWCRFCVDFGVDCCRISSWSILEVSNRKVQGFVVRIALLR
jgi:hypothetical protein